MCAALISLMQARKSVLVWFFETYVCCCTFNSGFLEHKADERIKKISEKTNFCPFSRGVLTWLVGYGGYCSVNA